MHVCDALPGRTASVSMAVEVWPYTMPLCSAVTPLQLGPREAW